MKFVFERRNPLQFENKEVKIQLFTYLLFSYCLNTLGSQVRKVVIEGMACQLLTSHTED